MKDLIEALQIFLKYSDRDYPTNCSHDLLYIDVRPEEISFEDKKRLEELSFNVNEELEGFTSFRFGSC